MLNRLLRRGRIKRGYLILVAKRAGIYQWLDLGDRNEFDLLKRRTDSAVREAARDRLGTVCERQVFEAMSKEEFVDGDTVYEVVEFDVLPGFEGHFEAGLRKQGFEWKDIDAHPMRRLMRLPREVEQEKAA